VKPTTAILSWSVFCVSAAFAEKGERVEEQTERLPVSWVIT
jgi:hypothetical protein